jgi:Helix-turn-helix domain
MTNSFPHSTQSADPFADYRMLVELATDCFAAARLCPSEAEIGEEYAIAAGEELTRVRAAFAAANAAPSSEKTNASKDAVATTAANRSPRRQRKARSAPPDGLRTMTEAAAKLGCSIKTLKGHMASGALRYANIGHGKKRPTYRFTDADLDAFIASQTRKDSPCPPTAAPARRSGSTISGGEVVAFTALRNARPGAKPKK